MTLRGFFIFSVCSTTLSHICEFAHQLKITFAKQYTKPSKMHPEKDQRTREDIINAPKVQYVQIIIQSLHIHESGMTYNLMAFLTIR